MPADRADCGTNGTNSKGGKHRKDIAGSGEHVRRGNPRVQGFHDFSSVRVASAGLGKAAALGSLSVPPSWVTAAPESELVSISTINTAPLAAPGRRRGFTFQDALMATMGQRHDDDDNNNDNNDNNPTNTNRVTRSDETTDPSDQ